MRWSAR